MTAQRSRQRILASISRLREIEAMRVRSDLADAIATQSKMSGLKHRTATLAGEYAQAGGALQGDDVARALSLSRSLGELSQVSAQQEAEAGQSAQRSSEALAKIEHQQDRLKDWADAIHREISAREMAQSAQTPNLARQLLNRGS